MHCSFKWNDTLCVNQRDKDERAAQASIMQEIYEETTRIYVWFSAPSNESKFAIEKILEWHRSLNHQIESFRKCRKAPTWAGKIPLSIDAFADVKSEAVWATIDDLCASE